MGDVYGSCFYYIVVYCCYFFNFVRKYIEFRNKDYIFFMVNNIEIIFIIYCCNIIGSKLIVFENFFCGFWVI